MADEFERDDDLSPRPNSDSTNRGSAGGPRRGRSLDDDDFESRRPKGDNTVKIIVIVVCGVLLVAFLGVATCIGLVVYGVNQAQKAVTAAMRNAGMYVQEQNNYKQVALAMEAYENEHGELPPPAMKTRTGKPGLSWRVAILPYMGEKTLHLRFKLDEPWDSPTNRPLAEEMPMVFASTLDPSPDQTHMRLIIGKGAIYEPNRVLKRAQITDGMSRTILIVESAKSVLWTEPDELKFDPNGPLPELGLVDRDFFFAAMADGEVRPVRKTIAPEKIKAAITAAGNEKVNLDE